jgi:hypothetical protein
MSSSRYALFGAIPHKPIGVHKFVSGVPHVVGKIGFKANRVAWPQNIAVERDLDPELPAQNEAVFSPIVRRRITMGEAS